MRFDLGAKQQLAFGGREVCSVDLFRWNIRSGPLHLYVDRIGAYRFGFTFEWRCMELLWVVLCVRKRRRTWGRRAER